MSLKKDAVESLEGTVSPQPAQLSGPRGRLEYLDVFRAIAALAVLVQHAYELGYPSFDHFLNYDLNLGVFGVTLFFLCSGFIIPVSLEHGKSLGTFWKRRLTRLYPLYWSNLLALLICLKLHLANGSRAFPSSSTILANLTMMGKFTPYPLISGLYWTLSIEMVFYFSISILSLLRLSRFSSSIAGLLMVGAILSSSLHLEGSGLALYFSTMFIGTVLLRCSEARRVYWRGVGTILLAIVALYVNSFLVLLPNDDQGPRNRWAFSNAFLAAYAVFIVGLITKSWRFPKPLIYLGAILSSLGVISYSTYLDQDLPNFVIPFGFPYRAELRVAATLLLAFATYRFIEAPGMKLGRKKWRLGSGTLMAKQGDPVERNVADGATTKA